MRFEAAAFEDVERALEYFNAFHDGFVSEILIRSHDHMEPDKSHVNTGLFEVEIVFAHYNYDEGRPPHDRRVQARFEDVQDIHLDFRGVTFDWAINTIEVERDEERLLLTMAANRYDAVRRKWSLERGNLFRFKRAVIWDDPAPVGSSAYREPS